MEDVIAAGRFCKGAFTYDHLISFPIDQYKIWQRLISESAKEAAKAAEDKDGK